MMRRMMIPAMIVLGALSATGFAPLDLWPATLICLALLIAATARAGALWQALSRGYWFGVGHFSVGLNWIAHAFTFQDKMPAQLGYLAVVLLSCYLAVYLALAAGLAWRFGQGDSARIAPLFAAGWIVTEWLRATMFTGFAWNPLGAIWLPLLPVAESARWVGTFGLSGLVVIAAGGLLLLFERRWKAGASAIAAIFIAALAALQPAPKGPAGPLIRVVQPNIPQQEKEGAAYDRANFRKLAGLSGSPGVAPRLILWPEAAIPEFIEFETYARLRIASLLGPQDMLLAGGVSLIGDAQDRVIAARNSLFALTPDGRITGRYDKSHLVPYGEYLPMRPILSAIGLSRLVPGDLDFWPGPGPQSMEIPGFGKVGMQICYEIIFPGHVIDERNRPLFLFNPSNDAWFGAWGPPQHLAQARLRAIEEGVPVVRSTPTGISAVIDTRGAILQRIPRDTGGYIEMRAPPLAPPTPFARAGNLLSLALALLLAALAVAMRRRAR
ncbi:MAG: apolipoprotein N-acyltransferase [Sphingomonas sanxanigenens]|uniref:Apolipoprotein N-acyltransferase n=1 Tax=Sphingomonas sanxanigenens TaxID=397260 RepID=A0A2W5C3H1_9SPHN|nr:MAG: apolipoprotein N-acyltransferase [Sphingomonas sanxanigenens]